MHLVPRGPGVVELLAIRIAEGLMVAGQRLHARFAVVPSDQADEFWEWSEQWRAALAAFVTWSAPLDFSRGKTLRAGICSRTDFERLMWVLKRAGVIVVYPKSGTRWAHGWSKRRFLSELRRHELTPPFPVGLPVPKVLHTRVLESQERQPSQAGKLGSSTVFARDVTSSIARPGEDGQGK